MEGISKSSEEKPTKEEVLKAIEVRKVQLKEQEEMMESCRKNIVELERQIQRLSNGDYSILG